MNKNQVEESLKELYDMKSWSSVKNEPREFNNFLNEFGSFEVYNNYRDFLETNDYYLYDFEGEEIEVEDVLSSKENYEQFVENHMNASYLNTIQYEDINKEMLFGLAKDTTEPHENFVLLEELKTESDLVSFVNDVISDHGEVTHSSGLKSQYEVIGKYQDTEREQDLSKNGDDLNRKRAIQRLNQFER